MMLCADIGPYRTTRENFKPWHHRPGLPAARLQRANPAIPWPTVFPNRAQAVAGRASDSKPDSSRRARAGRRQGPGRPGAGTLRWILGRVGRREQCGRGGRRRRRIQNRQERGRGRCAILGRQFGQLLLERHHMGRLQVGRALDVEHLRFECVHSTDGSLSLSKAAFSSLLILANGIHLVGRPNSRFLKSELSVCWTSDIPMDCHSGL